MTDTRDTPEAALAAALERHHDSEGFCVYCSSGRVFEPWPCDSARAREEIARLRAALEEIASDEFGYPLCSLGEEMAGIALNALAPAPSEPTPRLFDCPECDHEVDETPTFHAPGCALAPAPSEP